MFVLVGQVLNSRGRFGPMMWAPIANNVDLVVILTIYLMTIGPATGAEKHGGFTAGAEALLGHRLDPRHRGAVPGAGALPAGRGLPLPAALRLPRHRSRATPCGSGVWTVLFVVVNQIAYTVVVRIASSGTVAGPGRWGARGHRLHRLLQLVPADDGPARDHHRLAGHGDAAAALAVRRRG